MELILSYKIRFVRKTRISNSFFLLFLMKRIFRLIHISLQCFTHSSRRTYRSLYARVKLRIHFSFLKKNSSTVGKMMYLSFSFLVQGRIYITYIQGNKRPRFKVGFHPRLYRESNETKQFHPGILSSFLPWKELDDIVVTFAETAVSRELESSSSCRVLAWPRNHNVSRLQSQGCSDENATRERIRLEIAFRFYEKLFQL